MSRSANRARIAWDVAGDGGIGMPKGMATWIVTSSRTPRLRSSSSSSSAASLGAGGHLNGVPHTPTIALPPEKFASTPRAASAPATE